MCLVTHARFTCDQWTRELGYSVREMWHPWSTISTGDNVVCVVYVYGPGSISRCQQSQVKAGYVTQYGGQGVNEFYFVTSSLGILWCSVLMLCSRGLGPHGPPGEPAWPLPLCTSPHSSSSPSLRMR